MRVRHNPVRQAEVGETAPPATAEPGVAAESRTLLRIAGPIILSQLGAVGMSTMDTIMVGPLGADALAAIGLAGALHWAILVVTRPAMVITFIGLGVNFLGNSAFIYGMGDVIPAMGAVGSGWATTAVRWAMLLAMVIYIVRNPGLRPFTGIGFRPDLPLIRRVMEIGTPTGIQTGLEVALFSFAAVMMGWFGAVELATHQVAINIASTTFMVALGFSLAGSIVVGQRIGAGDQIGTQRAVLLTYGWAMLSMTAFAGVLLAFPETILRLYTQEPAVIELGASLLFMAAAFQIFDGAQAAGFAVLRGAADTRVPMVIAGIAYWGIGAPAAYLLGFRTALGPVGVWAGLVLGLAAAMALLAWRVHRIHWRYSIAAVHHT